MSEKPREYTESEIREKFIRHIWNLIDYWEYVQTNDGYGPLEIECPVLLFPS